MLMKHHLTFLSVWCSHVELVSFRSESFIALHNKVNTKLTALFSFHCIQYMLCGA